MGVETDYWNDVIAIMRQIKIVCSNTNLRAFLVAFEKACNAVMVKKCNVVWCGSNLDPYIVCEDNCNIYSCCHISGNISHTNMMNILLSIKKKFKYKTNKENKDINMYIDIALANISDTLIFLDNNINK